MTHLLLAVAIAALYLLHQDLWFWNTSHPLIFGFLPIGLAWHAAYCVASAALMWALTRLAWPAHLARSMSEETGSAIISADPRLEEGPRR